MNRKRGVKKRSRTNPTWFSTLFPSQRRCASYRLDEIVAAHLRKTAIVKAILADEDRLNGRFHVVVNAALAGAFEKGKGTVMGIESKLQKTSRFGAFLCSTLSRWRSVRISASSEARDRKSPMKMHQISLSNSPMKRSGTLR